MAEEMDHINHLPDAIIHHIFSFLPFKDVVKTSVLSQQWRFAWTSTPYIDLSVPSKDVVPWISGALRRCTAPKIDKFHLDVTTLDLNILTLLDLWFPLAAARKVEEVSLGSERRYHLPRILCESTSLVSLRVYGCCLSRDTIIKCTSLKKLCIDNFDFEDDRIMQILSCCTVLESLTLRSSTKLRKVRVNSRSLRELVIENLHIETLDISAPNLLSLRLWGHFLLYCFRLSVASPLLAEATTLLDCIVTPAPSGHLGDQLKFLDQLQHAPKITIGSWWVKVLSAAESKGMSHILSSWRSIVVYTIVWKRDLLGMAYLLRSSPLLERLVICNPKSNDKDFSNLWDFDENNFWRSQREFYRVANHLKRVEIVGFEFDNGKSKPLLALAMFILGKAIILEKMIIKVELRTSSQRAPPNPPGPWYFHDVFHDVIQLKEGCPRASPNAEVIIEYLLDGLPYELCKHKRTRCARFNFLKGIFNSKKFFG